MYVPVINKIDLPSADPERVINEIEDVIGIEAQDAPQISAKTGLNVDQVLEADRTQDPGSWRRCRTTPLKALIFDSLYDSIQRRDRILSVSWMARVKKGTLIHMMATGAVRRTWWKSAISEPVSSFPVKN